LVGLPGSGKSTYLARRALRALSSDAVRELLFDDVTEQRFQAHVFSVLRHLVRARLEAGVPRTFIDATSLSPRERKPWLALAAAAGVPAVAFYFDTPPSVCRARNRARARVVPADVMTRMIGKLRPPLQEEGFARVYRVTGEFKP
jgi:predicted kinase